MITVKLTAIMNQCQMLSMVTMLCVALICMQITHYWSNAPTITYFLEGQRSPSPFLIASQLTNYPKNEVQPVSKQQQHFTLGYFFITIFREDGVPMYAKHTNQKNIIEQWLYLHVFEIACDLRRLTSAYKFDNRACGDTCNQSRNRGNL